MPKQMILAFALLFQVLDSKAQKGIVMKVYHGNESTCNFYFTTDHDYILELFNDSSIQLSIYSSTTFDIRPPSATIFSGTCSVYGNTMKVTFLNQNRIEGKGLHQDSLFVRNDIVALPPPITFITTDSTILSPEKLMPTLRISSISVSTKFKADFDKRIQPTTFPLPKKVSNAKLTLIQ